ncbi:MAG: cysteine desulfurase, partial [Lachnospiraceae bacterium]|nr:cysteine desulfurase [Lachnospiraceae bacterium]
MDNSATTRCFDEVAVKMSEIMCNDYGNPSSAHHMGVVAEEHIRNASETIAGILRCKPDELIFTSGGSESDNLALVGAAHANKRKGMHLITTVIEHPAVLRTMEQLQEEGYDISYLPTDKEGRVSLSMLRDMMREDTILVSVMHTNNEIGSVQPISEIGNFLKKDYPDVLFHVDAVQGFGKYRIYPKEAGIDLMSASGHKIHGPKGVGFLYVRKGVKLSPIIYGGGQQGGLRSGTENVAGISGMAVAADILYKGLEAERERLYAIKTEMINRLLSLPDVNINGIPQTSDINEGIRMSAPHIVSASFAGVRAEVLLHALEEKDIYVSAGSACATHKPEPSRTLQAIGLKKDMLEGTLRFSFSSFTKDDEPEKVYKALEGLLPQLRQFVRR